MRQYVATEQDISRIVTDFATFCSFLKEKTPLLSKRHAQLGKNDLFSLNSLLSRPVDVSGPYYLQAKYPTINLFFYLAMTSGLFAYASGRGNKACLVPTAKLEKYEALNLFTKYMFLFRIYWTKLDSEDLYPDAYPGQTIYLNAPDLLFQFIENAHPGEKITPGISGRQNDIIDHYLTIFFNVAGGMIHCLSDFGFWEYEQTQSQERYQRKSDILVKSIIPSEFGLAMARACRNRPYALYNEPAHARGEVRPAPNFFSTPENGWIIPDESDESTEEELIRPFEEVFLPLFPEDAINLAAIDELLAEDDQPKKLMAYVFKVSLDRNCWRRIKLSAAHTLDDLHDAIQSAFNFDNDHLYAFFMDGRAWSKKAYWDPRGEEPPYANEVRLDQLELWEGRKFLYLFDFGDEWRFDVLVEEVREDETPPSRPVIIGKKGEAPEQYPSWE